MGATEVSLVPASSRTFVQAVGVTDAFLNEDLAVARDIPELADGPGGTKLARMSPCSTTGRSRRQSLKSLLRPGHLGDLGDVGKNAGERLFADVEDGPPVDAGALHGRVRDAVGLEAISKRHQVEGPHVLHPTGWPQCNRR